MNLLSRIWIRCTSVYARTLDTSSATQFLSGILATVLSARDPLQAMRIRKSIARYSGGDYPTLAAADRLRIAGWIALLQTTSGQDADVVEAGTGYGNTALTLFAGLVHAEDKRKLHCFDSFTGFPAGSDQDEGQRVRKGKRIAGWEGNSESILPYIVRQDPMLDRFAHNLIMHKGMFADTMQFLPEAISLLHVDCDLYESTKTVLASAYPRLVKGAVVIFDEYDDPKWPGVRKAVDEFLSDASERPRYIKEVLRYGIIKQ